MENFTPISATAGGALIGVSVTLLLLFNGRIGGISGIMNGALFAPNDERNWRLIFIAGLILGAFIFHRLAPDFNMPRQNLPFAFNCIGRIPDRVRYTDGRRLHQRPWYLRHCQFIDPFHHRDIDLHGVRNDNCLYCSP